MRQKTIFRYNNSSCVTSLVFHCQLRVIFQGNGPALLYFSIADLHTGVLCLCHFQNIHAVWLHISLNIKFFLHFV